jgi:ATP-dependent RNA helicase DeaD
MSTDFSALGLRPELIQAVSAQGYTTPTPIQEQVIPILNSGRDVIAQSETGSGKTAAFSFPILNQMELGKRKVQTLILSPTRELAMQVANAIYNYGAPLNASVLAIYGGQSYSKQINRLKSGVDIVVGTPGRMIDLIKRKSLKLNDVKFVVLDEADEMLSMGFIDDIEFILKETSSTRQTALFSATMPKAIQKLGTKYLNNPETIMIKSNQMTVSTIEQKSYMLRERDKLSALTRILEYEDFNRVLVFARTRKNTNELANELNQQGYPAEALNGDLNQDTRTRVLNKFKTDKLKILVATDVAARGLDINDISHVVNYDIPTDPEVFVHRVGRTGRAGKAGIAITFFTPSEAGKIRRIEGYAKTKLKLSTLPTIEEMYQYREEKLLDQLQTWIKRGRAKREMEIVLELVENGMDPLELAAVSLKMARKEEKRKPISQIREMTASDMKSSGGRNGNRRNGRSDSRRNGRSEGKRNGRSESRNGNGNGRKNGSRDFGGKKEGGSRRQEEGMVKIGLNLGKSHGVRPNDIVGKVAFHADIPGHAIGKITIKEDYSQLDVQEQFVKQVLASSGKFDIHKERVQLEKK